MAKDNGIKKANGILRVVLSSIAVLTVFAGIVLAYGDVKAGVKHNKESIGERTKVDEKILEKLDIYGERQARMMGKMGIPLKPEHDSP